MTKPDFVKNKNVCSLKTLGENIWKSNHISNKGLLAKIYINTQNDNKKTTQLKMGKMFE